jgi:hypothetical protein
MKTQIVFTKRWDPNNPNVAYVAIQACPSKGRPFVWRIYLEHETLPRLGPDMALIPIKAARALFDFVDVEKP